MFGKKKKDKKKQPETEFRMRTMQDDIDELPLDGMGESNTSAEDKNIRTNLEKSPFGIDSKQIKKSQEKAKADNAPKKEIAPKLVNLGPVATTKKNENQQPKKENNLEKTDMITVMKSYQQAGEKNKSKTNNQNNSNQKVDEIKNAGARKEEKTEKITVSKKKNKKRGFFKRLFKWLLMIMLAGGLVEGGIYLYPILSEKITQIRGNKSIEAIDENIEKQRESIKKEEKENIVVDSSDLPQFLAITVEQKNQIGITSAIIAKFNSLADQEDKVAEMKVVNSEDNSLIPLAVFLDNFGISFPGEITNNFTDDYTILLCKNAQTQRLGLQVKISETADIENVKKIFLELEKTAVDTFNPMFLNNELIANMDVSLEKYVFNDSLYKDIAIRYVNLDAEETLSIDYAIVDNKLIVATSKNSMRKIIDDIMEKKETVDDVSSEDTSKNIFDASSQVEADLEKEIKAELDNQNSENITTEDNL